MTTEQPSANCKNTFVSKKSLWKILPILLLIAVPTYAVAINIWASDKANEEKFASIERVADVERASAILNEKFNSLFLQIQDLKDQQKENTREIIKTIKERNK